LRHITVHNLHDTAIRDDDMTRANRCW
jgi:hypothetical protein